MTTIAQKLIAQLGLSAGSDLPLDMLAPFPPGLVLSGSVLGAANRGVGCRVVAKKSGFIRDVSALVTAQSGNIDVGIYNTGDTTPTVRTKIGSSGSIACPAVSTAPLVALWDPGAGAIPIVAGRQYDFVLSADNNIAAFGRIAGTVANWAPTTYVTPGNVQYKGCWFAATVFPLPNTIAEAATANTTASFLIFGRISPT